MNERGEMDLDRLLEAHFEAGRAAAPKASETLLNRVSMAAEAERALNTQPRAAGGWFAWLADAPVGWGSLGGMVAAAAVGVWIGYAGIGGINTLSGALLGAQDDGIVDLLPAVEDFALASGER